MVSDRLFISLMLALGLVWQQVSAMCVPAEGSGQSCVACCCEPVEPVEPAPEPPPCCRMMDAPPALPDRERPGEPVSVEAWPRAGEWREPGWGIGRVWKAGPAREPAPSWRVRARLCIRTT